MAGNFNSRGKKVVVGSFSKERKKERRIMDLCEQNSYCLLLNVSHYYKIKLLQNMSKLVESQDLALCD